MQISRISILSIVLSLFPLGPLQYPGEIKNKSYAKFWEVNKVNYGRCANGESDIKWHLILHPFISSLGNFRSDWDNEVPFYLCFSALGQFAVSSRAKVLVPRKQVRQSTSDFFMY